MPKHVSPETRKPAWIFPTGLRSITTEFSNVLPDEEETLLKHTLFPYFSAFLASDDVEVLRQHHIISAKPGICGITGSNLYRGRMAVCIECMQEDLSNKNGPGYATWKRIHCIPRMLMCHRHERLLMTFCESCEDGHRRLQTNWLPSFACKCEGSLRPVVDLNERDHDSELKLTSLAAKALNGEFPNDLQPSRVTDLTRRALSCAFPNENFLAERLSQALLDTFGTSSLEQLFVTPTTLSRLVGDGKYSRLGPVRNPMHVLAVVQSLFGDFEGLSKASNAGQAPIPNTFLVVEAASKTKKRKPRKTLRGQAYADSMAKLPLEELQRRTDTYRAWVLEQLRTHTDFLRCDMAALPNGFSASRHLKAMDREWFDHTLPPYQTFRRKKKIDAETKKRIVALSTHIRNRHALALHTIPLNRIDRRFLLNSFPSESNLGAAHHSIEIKALLESLAETDGAFRARVTPLVCKLVSAVVHDHYFGVEQSFAKLTDFVSFRKRLYRAKRWLAAQTT
jgi:hypothetical protein